MADITQPRGRARLVETAERERGDGMRGWTTWGMVALLAIGLPSAGSQADDEVPRLVLDSGGHTAKIKQVLFTPDGKEVITVSDDKTIRIWNVATGESARILRPPVGDGSEGMIYAAALSPDGQILAIGGYASPSENYGTITLISLAEDQIIRRLMGHMNVVYDLDFSADGRLLISGSSDSTARIWNVATGETTQVLKGHKKSLSEVAFSPDGERCVTGSQDGTAAIWSIASGQRLTTLQGHTKEVRCLDWSPDGSRLATGSYDYTIRLWTSEGKLHRVFDDLGNNNVLSVRFTADSQQLLYTQSWYDSGGKMVSGLIDLNTGRQKIRFSGHVDTIMDGEVSPDGRLAATSGARGETILWRTSDGQQVHLLASRGRTMMSAAWSRDGTSVAWGSTNTGSAIKATKPLERSFDLERLETVSDLTSTDWQRATLDRGSSQLVSSGNTSVDVRQGTQTISTLQPTKESDKVYDKVYSFTFLPGNHAAVGSNYGVSLYDTISGKRHRKCVGHTGAVWAVSPSPDGRYLLSASNDMTLRVWNVDPEAAPQYTGIGTYLKLVENGLLVTSHVPDSPAAIDGRLRSKDVIVEAGSERNALQPVKDVNDLAVDDGKTIWLKVQRPGVEEPVFIDLVGGKFRVYSDIDPLVSLFFAENDWIAWTPQGYYATSPGGERLMGWHINNGPDQLASFYPAAQFRKQFYRPDVIKLLLKTGSVEAALEEAGTEGPVQSIAENLPPQVEIVSPREADTVAESEEITVRVRATQRGANPITSVQLLIDGRPLDGKGSIQKVEGESATVTHRFYVPLVPGVEHAIQAKANSGVSYGVSKEVRVTYQPPNFSPTLPRLYVLAIGVADYDDETLKLNYADDDARLLAKTLEERAAGLYRSIDTKLIVDKDATQKGILSGLVWLKQQMTQHDVGVLFYSGHGERDELGDLYLLPCDVDTDNPLLLSGVPDAQIKSVLQGTPGRMIVMLDACHAGSIGGDRRKDAGAPTDDLVRDLATDDYGVVVMASSMGREFSLESPDNKSGMFTLALCEGLNGDADLNRDDHVYFHELDVYVSDRVKELSNGRQHPATARPTTIRPFPLASSK